MDAERRLAVSEPGGRSFEPTLGDTVDRSIHQIPSIIHRFNLIAEGPASQRHHQETQTTTTTGDTTTYRHRGASEAKLNHSRKLALSIVSRLVSLLEESSSS